LRSLLSQCGVGLRLQKTSEVNMSAALRLKPNQDKRLRAGHLWVYSNEIDTKETPLKGLTPGQPVVIENAHGKFVAHA
jgi:hypothetical protein